MAWQASKLFGVFEEALAWLRQRAPMRKEQADKIDSRAKQKAFWVAGVDAISKVEAVQKSLDKAIQEGQSFDDWKKTARDVLQASSKQHVETVYRTNVQLAYGVGRQERQATPAYRAARPYLKVQTVGDGRRSAICTKLKDVVMPADDPRWNVMQPPFHFNCRTTLRALRAKDVERQGGITGWPENAYPQPGFGLGNAAPPSAAAAGLDPNLVATWRQKANT